MDLSRDLLIVSAELAGNKDNMQRTRTLRHCLEDLDLEFLTATGCYNGVEEESFIVFLPLTSIEEYDTVYKTVCDFAFKNFDQEAVLHQENDMAWLVVNDNGKTSSQYIGQMVEVNPKEIERLENFTVVNGRVFTTRKLTI